MSLLDINLLALGLSIVICSIIGAGWYSAKLFGTIWAREQGKTMETLGNPVPPLVVQLFATSCICAMVGGLHYLSRQDLLPTGIAAIFWAALLLQTWAARLWLGFNRIVCMIDTGYVAVLLAVPTVVFCLLSP